MPSSLFLRRPLLVALVVPVMALTACDPNDSRAPAPERGSSSSAGLDRFYRQDLAFGSCDGYATTPTDKELFAAPGLRCARLEVPLDYDAPGGKSARLAVLRVPARGAAKGSLVVNSGGPGGTGQNFAVQTGIALAKSPLTENFDIVGFDPRGVGATEPSVHCFGKEDRLAGNARTEFVLTAGVYSEKDTKRLVGKCARGSGGEEVLGTVSTRDTVRDMDVLRSALGAEKLNFLGQSYGTRIGALYAQEYPQRVGAMVLDGAVDPHLGQERRLSQYAGFQRSFDAMAAACAEDASCPLGTDPAHATEAFHRIARPLLDEPLVYGQGLKFTYNDLIDSVIAGLYYEAVWPKVIQGVADVRKGDPARLLALSRAFSGQDAEGGGGNFSEANYAITCMDEARMTPGQAAEMRARVYRSAPFADPGTGTAGARDACEFWPAEPKTAYPFPDRVEKLPPTLIVSITGDPSTPHQAGVNLARTLGGALLTVGGKQHTIVSAGTNACVNKVVSDYLIDRRVPRNARCTL